MKIIRIIIYFICRWGHGRYETIGSLCVSSLLLVAGYTIGVSSYNSFKTTFSTQTNDETTLLLNSLGCGVLILSLLSKEWLYRVTVKIGKKYNSSTLIANAWHHRSDALSSLMALVGFAGRLIKYIYIYLIILYIVCLYLILLQV